MQLDTLKSATDRTSSLIQYLEQAGISIILKTDLEALFDRIDRQDNEIKALEYRISTLMKA